ncbi:MAG: DUF6482 family protein [Marinobacter sp.]|nr:DUF6482 family protein [Marinobacter sp.]
MRVTLADLRETEDVTIDLLEILSIEGQRYMARLTIDQRQRLLSDSDGQTALFRSSWEIQDVLGAFAVKRTEIVHPSAYNEMIGMNSGSVEPLRIQIQRQKS